MSLGVMPSNRSSNVIPYISLYAEAQTYIYLRMSREDDRAKSPPVKSSQYTIVRKVCLTVILRPFIVSSIVIPLITKKGRFPPLLCLNLR